MKKGLIFLGGVITGGVTLALAEGLWVASKVKKMAGEIAMGMTDVDLEESLKDLTEQQAEDLKTVLEAIKNSVSNTVDDLNETINKNKSEQ